MSRAAKEKQKKHEPNVPATYAFYVDCGLFIWCLNCVVCFRHFFVRSFFERQLSERYISWHSHGRTRARALMWTSHFVWCDRFHLFQDVEKNKQQILWLFTIRSDFRHSWTVMFFLVWKLQPNAHEVNKVRPATQHSEMSPTIHTRCEREFRVNIDAEANVTQPLREWERDIYARILYEINVSKPVARAEVKWSSCAKSKRK